MPEVFENLRVMQTFYSDEGSYSNGVMNGSTGIPSPYTSSPDSYRQASMSSPMSIISSPQDVTNFFISIPGATTIDPPYLSILEQPIEKFRFRYKSEMMGTHGSLAGANSIGNRKKNVPMVQLHNWMGKAIIRCTLVTSDPDKRIPHAHRLVKREGNTDQDDPHHIEVSPENGFIAAFYGMGIIHTAKKHVKDELIQKMKREALERCKRVNANLGTREEMQIRTDAEVYQKCMNLNSVALCFQAFALGSNDVMSPITEPVYSHAINNLKSALTGELKICRIDKYTSSSEGGEEVFMLVEKVGKKNIKIRFFELNEDDNEVWVDYGIFNELDVHHQYAIVFRTPAYKDVNIRKPKEVYIQLERPSDGDLSEPIKFTYKPSDKIMGRNRARVQNSGSLDMTQLASSFFSSTNGNENLASNSSQQMSSEIRRLLNEGSMPSEELKDFVNNINLSDYELWAEKSEEIALNPLLVTDGPISRKDDMAFFKNFVVNAVRIMKTEPEKRKQRLQKLLKDRSTYGDTPLHAALRYGQQHVVKIILMLMVTDQEFAKLVNAQNSSGKTPLHFAVERNLPEVVKVLLLLGADPNKCDDYGFSPLHTAVKAPERGACVDALLSEKITSINNRNDAGWAALQLAVEAGSYHAVRSLVKAGADVNDVEISSGRTALHIAVEGGHVEILKFLLKETNVDVNKKNNSGNTALHVAVVSQGIRAKEMCKILLEHKADPRISNDDRETPRDEHRSCEVKIKTEVESEEENFDEMAGLTSFDLASQKPEILELLRQTEEQPNPVDIVTKEEIIDDEESGMAFLDNEQMEALSVILDQSRGWKKLAKLLNIEVLFDVNVESKPSLFLLKYINIQGDVSAEKLRNLLEEVEEKTAARFVTDILSARSMRR